MTDAVFESVSGVTTTGSTIINGLDRAPPGLLVWRSLLSFMGGLGVIALGLFLLPFLNLGGVSYFKIESSDIQDRPFARLQTFLTSLIGIYAFLVLSCATAYTAAGMEGFHAINHAMTTVATGGFSTHDTSFLRYDQNAAILWIGGHLHVHRRAAVLDHDPACGARQAGCAARPADPDLCRLHASCSW